MAEVRLYHSIIAEQRCNAGAFIVYGHHLKPFCLRHSLQLEALGNPLWSGDRSQATPADVALAAQICASHQPVTDFQPLDLEMDPVEQIERWRHYLQTCAARPMLKQRTAQTLGDTFSVPIELLAVSYLMRMTNITEERAWTMPYGLAWWYVEAIRDQEEGDAMILTEEEAAALEAMNTEEAQAAERERNRIAGEIINTVKDAAARQKLLTALVEGTLDNDWRAQWQTT